MSVWGIGAFAVAAIGTGYSVYKQNQAAHGAAAVDTASAAYNAKYDEALAQQLDLDTLENIRRNREEAGQYLSREEVSYASAGVLATSGTPLHAMITNAGRLEKDIQQRYTDSTNKQESYRIQGRQGIAAGEASAYADRAKGTLALINGGASIAGRAFSAYNSGLFSGGGTTTSDSSKDFI